MWEDGSSEAPGWWNTAEASDPPNRTSDWGLAVKAIGTCSVTDCDRPHLARGWCKLHYDRWRHRGGDPAETLPSGRPFEPGHIGRPRSTDYPVLFESYVDRTTTPDGCHTWTGARDRDGYGVFHIEGRQVRAPRWALEQATGPLGDLLACHRCDNPPCVRVDHLFGGTVTDNNRDKVAKGRARVVR